MSIVPVSYRPTVEVLPHDPFEEILARAYRDFLLDFAESTRRTYKSRLHAFADWKSRQDEMSYLTLLKTYLAYLRETRKLQPRTIQGHMHTLKNWIKMASALEPDNADLAMLITQLSLLKAPKAIGQVQGKRLAADEMMRLIHAPGTKTAMGLRDTAILGLLGVLGLRRHEVCNLTWGHITRIEGIAVIANLSSKHGRVRTIKLPEWLLDVINAWGAISKRDVSNPAIRVFCPVTRDSFVLDYREKLTPHAIYKLVCKWSEKVGTPVKPHDLRRTAALLSRRNGAQIEQVQVMLGHASPQTTSAYIGEGVNLQDHAVDYSPIRVSL